MAGDDNHTTRNLENTPTWAVATVVLVLIVVSIFIEHLLHLLTKLFSNKRRKSLIQAFDKIQSALMLLGFISLLLTVCQKPIADICIPKHLGETFLPCSSHSLSDDVHEEPKCEEQDKFSLLSQKGVQQLQYLIFVLAFFHSVSSAFTFNLGMIKMKRWESWETETRTLNYQFQNDPRRFKLLHQTSFGKRHLRFWSEHPILRWPASFIRQFYGSVSKVDYLTLRHGFISAHFEGRSDFDFQKYIERALEKDFGVVIGMSLWIWILSLVFIFFNAHKFHNSIWLPIIPLVMLLLVGTKLQGIITKMCLDSRNKSHVVQGKLLVTPSDHFFWFGRPRLLLHLIHFILFQNSFQVAFFVWSTYKYGLRSCFHQKTEDIVIRIATGILVQFLCGYVTLPLYALVTQMGTSMKKTVFSEEVAEGLKRWRTTARKNLAMSNFNSTRPSVKGLHESVVDIAPSFSFDPSYSIELDRSSSDAESEGCEIKSEDQVSDSKQLEEHQKKGYFHGCNIALGDE